jgi:DNA-binding Lrp family transcriptional regulator
MLRKIGIDMTQHRILDYLKSNPMTTAGELHEALGVPVSGTCSRLHKDGVIRAESIWVTDRPTIKKPVLHYFVGEQS